MGEAGEVGVPDGELEDQPLISPTVALLWIDQSKFAKEYVQPGMSNCWCGTVKQSW